MLSVKCQKFPNRAKNFNYGKWKNIIYEIKYIALNLRQWFMIFYDSVSPSVFLEWIPENPEEYLMLRAPDVVEDCDTATDNLCTLSNLWAVVACQY